MKKALYLFSTLIAVAILATSFKSKLAAPKLYPELEAFFKTLDAKQFEKTHLNALENIKYNITTSNLDYEDWNVIFYCSENTFRSQASQVFAQTLCYARKHKKVKVFSAGLTAGEVNPDLIAYLSKIGYKVSKQDKDGKTVYEIKFSDNTDPITLFSKTVSDKSLPAKDITSVIVCDVAKETDCAALKTGTTPLNLPFEKVSTQDTKEKIETTLKNIAIEMVYVTNK